MEDLFSKKVTFVGFDNVDRIWDGEKFIDDPDFEYDYVEIYINNEHKATVGKRQEVVLDVKENDVINFVTFITKAHIIVTHSFPDKILFKLNRNRKNFFDAYTGDGKKLPLKNSLVKKGVLEIFKELMIGRILALVFGFILLFVLGVLFRLAL